MRLKLFILISGLVIFLGCSNSQKKETALVVQAPSATSANSPTAQLVKPITTLNEMICERGSEETRTLQLENSQPIGCKLIYSNFSDSTPVAWSTKGKTHCEQVQERIRGKLEEAGFKCKNKELGSSASPTVPLPAQKPNVQPEPPKSKN